MGTPVSNECTVALNNLLGAFKTFGLPAVLDKLEGPDLKQIFLGI